jgi:hypothetical protein
MPRRLFAFLSVLFAFALTFLFATPASAAVVRDADKFSVDTGSARICWVSPLSLRNAADCEGLSPDLVPEKTDGQARVIALGLLRLEQPGEQPEIGLVMVMHVDVALTMEPTDETAKDFAEGAHKGFEKELRKGATLRPATNVRVVKATYPQKHPLIRLVLDVDGIPEGADDQLLEHQIQMAGIADDGIYSVAYLTRRRHAKQVEAYADSVTTSFTMKEPAMSNKAFDKKMEAIGSVIVLVGTLIVGGIISLIVVLSRRNKPAPYAYPYPYQSQSSYPPPAWHPASAHAHAPPHAQQQYPQPQYQPRYYSMPPTPIPPPPAVPRREWWDELQ